MTAQKVIRAQNIAIETEFPRFYLVYSCGRIPLPLQENVFFADPMISCASSVTTLSFPPWGIPQITAIMACASRAAAYLPVSPTTF